MDKFNLATLDRIGVGKTFIINDADFCIFFTDGIDVFAGAKLTNTMVDWLPYDNLILRYYTNLSEAGMVSLNFLQYHALFSIEVDPNHPVFYGVNTYGEIFRIFTNLTF